MKTTTLILALLAPLLGGGGGSDCIPDGATGDVCLKRPGKPPAGEWDGDTGSPQAFENDPVFDDPAGPADSNEDGSVACVTIENRGGVLYLPNGETMDGDDYECGSIYIEWYYWVFVYHHFYGRYGGAEVGGTWGRWVRRSVRQGPVDVCPC